MIILGIDPGSNICGYGVIRKENRKITLVEYGVVNAKKMKLDINNRIKEIFLRIDKVIERTKPDNAVFESTFYSKNAQSLMKLSQARASAILAATLHDIPVFEFTPREIKKAVTGNGNASKEQVQFMIRKLLSIEETPEFFDATDALAVAVCQSIKTDTFNTKSKSWDDFIKKNQHLVINPNEI